MGDASIYDAACACSAVFGELLSTASARNADKTCTQELWGRFNLWAAFVGAFSPSKSSLDARLAEHDDIREMVVELVVMIMRNLNKEMEKLVKSEEASKRLEPPELDDLQGLPGVEAAVNQLHSLGVLIRRSSVRTHKLSISAGTLAGEATACIELVKRRFNVDNKRKIKGLWNHLGVAIHARGKAMAYRQRHNLKLASRREEGKFELNSSSQDGTHIQDNKTTEEEGSKILPQARRREDAMSGTAASIFDKESFDRNVSSYNRPSSLSTSQGTYIPDPDNNVDWYDYPSPPVLELKAKEVPCNLCSEPLKKFELNDDMWRSHVDRDLEPYVCVSEECRNPFRFFIHRKEWKIHMQNAHNRDWARTIYNKIWFCETDHEREFYDEREVFIEHLTTCHGNVLTEPQILVRTRRSRTIDIRDPFACPICDCSPPEVESQLTENLKYEPLWNHIARHLKAISFISLSYLDIRDNPGGSVKSDEAGISHNRVEISNTSHLIQPGETQEWLEDLSSPTLADLEESSYVSPQSIPDDLSPNWPYWMTEINTRDNEVDETLHHFAVGLLRQGNESHIGLPKLGTNSPQEGHASISPTAQPTTTDILPLKIFVAVDFGLAYSSIAYSSPVNLKDFRIEDVLIEKNMITSWPDTSIISDHVPTLPENSEHSSYKWGYQIEYDEIPVEELFKFHIAPELLTAPILKKWPPLTPASGTAGEMVITDFLRGLTEHVEEHLSDRLDREIVSRITKQYIFPVSSIWSETAQEILRICAENAGMGNAARLQLVSQPEAATLYAKRHTLPGYLEKNDTFVTCVAGAGSVELASYTVDSIEPEMKFSNFGPITGSLCGSSILNPIFDQFLRDKFRDCSQWNEGHHIDALHRFETKIKREYIGDKQKSFVLPARGLPNNPSLGIHNGRFEVSGAEIDVVFEPVVSEVLGLVTKQIQNTQSSVRMVLIAGGFGQNSYLVDRIREAVAPTEVFRLENAETAVVKGALLWGLEGLKANAAKVHLGSRLLRSSYGIMDSVQYDPGTHDHSEHYIDAISGDRRINLMHWFALKGDELKETSVFLLSVHFSQQNVAESPLKEMSVTIYQCSQNNPPMYQTDQVTKLAELRVDFGSIPETDLNRMRGSSGRFYYNVTMDIEMSIQSASLEFALVYGGKKYDTFQASFS